MVSTRLLTATGIAIAVLLIGIYIPLSLQPSTSSSTTTSTSTSTSSTTATSSTATTTPTTSSTSTTTTPSTTTSSTSSGSSTITNGSFTYSPTYPVQVKSVQAITSQATDGTERVTFSVFFVNIGSSPIYVMGGCGSGLDSSVQPNPVIQKASGGPVCLCAMMILPIDQGQNHTSITPGCWSGYNYKLLQPGGVTVNLTLSWSPSDRSVTGSNSTSILATFTLP